jgi:ubiquinone/menaquinone biosynthesis C-methylase UbiE
MTNLSFDRVSFFYDFIERYILKDYQGSMDLINKYLSLKENYRVIDVGGGTGFFSQSIIEKVNEAVVVDPSYKMLKKIRNTNISVIQGEGSFLSIKNEIFDLAVLINVMHHIHRNKQKEVLGEVFRILRKNGSVFIIDAFLPKTLFNRLFCTIENLTVGKTYHISADKLESYLKDVGFTRVAMTYPKEHSWKYVALGTKKS